MSLALPPYDPTELDPYTQALDALVEKVQETRTEFGASHLNQWAQERYGGLNVRTMTPEEPDDAPQPDETPCLVIVGGETPDWEPHAIGDRVVAFVYAVIGYLYTESQREGNRFLWLTQKALGFPWNQRPDPLVDVDFLTDYQPIGPTTVVPMLDRRGLEDEEGEGIPFFRFQIDLLFKFGGPLIPFFRGH